MMNAIIKPPDRMFVYGTLKSGFGNEKIITEAGGTFFKGATVSGYSMWDMGGFPALLSVNGLGCRVTGEIFNINDKVLMRTDILEGVDTGFYKRGKVTTTDGYVCWMYYRELGKDVVSYRRIQNGFWRADGKQDTILQLTDRWPHEPPIDRSVARYTPDHKPVIVSAPASPPKEVVPSPAHLAFGGTRRPDLRPVEESKEAANG